MNVDEAMAIVNSSNLAAEWYDGSLSEAVGVLRAEVERLRAILPPTAHTGVRNGPSDGGWSVFAEKVVAERDAAVAEVKQLRKELAKLQAQLDVAAAAAMVELKHMLDNTAKAQQKKG